jgi:hypothetical protein
MGHRQMAEEDVPPSPALGAAGFGGTVHPLSEHTLALCGTRAGAQQLGERLAGNEYGSFRTLRACRTDRLCRRRGIDLQLGQAGL